MADDASETECLDELLTRSAAQHFLSASSFPAGVLGYSMSLFRATLPARARAIRSARSLRHTGSNAHRAPIEALECASEPGDCS